MTSASTESINKIYKEIGQKITYDDYDENKLILIETELDKLQPTNL